jgi:hypothetical protein
MVFATIFFVSRVVMLPTYILSQTLMAPSTNGLLVGNAGLVVLYGMQLFWFSKIVRIAFKAKNLSKD